MKIQELKVNDFVVLKNENVQDLKIVGRGPFKVVRILKRTIYLQGHEKFVVTASQLSCFFEICPLRLAS